MKRISPVLFSHKRKKKSDKELYTIRKIKLCVLAACAAAAVIFAAMVAIPQRGYAVNLDGQVVGVVKNADEAEEIIEDAEQRVSDILGYKYKIESTVEEASLAGEAEADTITEALMDSVEEIQKAYVLKIDGETAAAAEEESVILGAIENISSKYGVSEGSVVSFDNKVVIAFEYVSKDFLKTADEITVMLDPCSRSAERPLAVRTVVSEVHEEAIEFECEYTTDPTVYEGEELLLREGEAGAMSITEQVVYLNGVEQSRSEVSAVVVREPVSRQIALGTMFRPRYVSYGEYIWPAEGIITCSFGYRENSVGSSYHHGLDIGGVYRSNILAADGGEVIFAENVYSYGNLVKILHDNGDVTWYAHCDEIIVSVGDKVAQGDIIAYMGSTGISTGDHLHFEVHINDEAVDPITVLP